MLTEFESRVLAAASVARSAGFIQTYLCLLEVVRLLREGGSKPATFEYLADENASQKGTL